MNRLEILIEKYPDAELLSADGFDEAIIGVAYNKFTSIYNIVYSITKCIDILMTKDNMPEEEAREYFDYNVEGAYIGEKTPIWVDEIL
jgi:hypothetical protein